MGARSNLDAGEGLVLGCGLWFLLAGGLVAIAMVAVVFLLGS
jgi:hypothetical protein